MWLSDRREILEDHLQSARCHFIAGSTAGLAQGALPGGSTGGLDGRLDRGALPGGSTEGARYISMCTAMKPPVTATYPRDSHGLRLGNHGQRLCGTVWTSIQAGQSCNQIGAKFWK